MKAVILSGLAALLILLLSSCGDQDEAVKEAYQKGAADAILEVQNKVEQSKQQLMGEIESTLLIGAIIVLLVTFFGDIIAERCREQLVAEFNLTPDKQAALLSCGYLLLCAILALWCMDRCSAAWNLPVMVLLAGSTSVFFSSYLPSLFQPVKEPRRLALSKIKLVLFAVCVILAVHELLAADGMLRLPM